MRQAQKLLQFSFEKLAALEGTRMVGGKVKSQEEADIKRGRAARKAEEQAERDARRAERDRRRAVEDAPR